MNFSKKYTKILKTIIGLSLLGLLINQINFNVINENLRSGDIKYLIISFSIFIIAFVLIQSVKAHVFLNTITKNFFTTLKIILISAFFNNILPSNVGGDGVKIYYLHQIDKKEWAEPIVLSILDRIIGLAIIFIAGILYILFVQNPFRLKPFVPDIKLYLVLILGIIILILTSLYLLSKKYEKLFNKIKKYSQKSKKILKKIGIYKYCLSVLLSILFHGLRILSLYYLLLFLGDHIQSIDLVLVLFITAFISLLPISIGALGLMEGGISSSLILLGVSPTTAISVAIINRVFIILSSVIGGILFIFNKTKKKEIDQQATYENHL